MSQRRNHFGIDLMKFVAAMLVVAGHVRPLISYSLTLDVFVIHVLARVTIQFFFMTAGYLLFRKIAFPLREHPENRGVVFLYVKRILILYLIWYLIYAGIALFYFVKLVGFDLFGFYLFYRFLWTGSHLWYLFALAVAVVLAFVSLHYLSFKKALILGVVLYLVGLFGDAWYGVGVDLSINAPYDFYRFLFNTTRDGLFFGYFFVVMGAYFVKTSFKIRNPFFWFFTFMVGLTFEVYLLRAYSRPLDFNLLLFALPASICLFSGMVEIDLKERKIYRWLRDASLIVYLVHPLIIIVLPMILGGLGLGSLGSNSLFEYFAVALISYAFSWILLMAARYLPFLKYLF